VTKPLLFPGCYLLHLKPDRIGFVADIPPCIFWQHECKPQVFQKPLKLMLNTACGSLYRDGQSLSQRTESCSLQRQPRHCSPRHYRVTVAESNFGERKGSDAPFGTRRWNRLVSIPRSNKGDGGS